MSFGRLWKPRSKADLIKWLKRQYPEKNFRDMEANQLYAIFYKTIRKAQNDK